MYVYLLWHTSHYGGRDEKLLGVYATRTEAEDRVTRSRDLPGFREEPNGFHIAEYRVNADQWLEGFLTV
ncbi:hypothetical protein JOF53_008159 [Crossiella equi]|uniref:DUF7336 domain-containing protein n=1 Tax=Crossiella equi TaxID=130796 RepID=A0ABS5ARS6_9PSEU|nr:hypothetical protein [Crossiella equi]MBP2479287.1 hypothetical protein [Crossiella equi]